MKTTIAKILTEELLNPTFGTTIQLLKVLEAEYFQGFPKIANIEIDDDKKYATAYINVKNESFYLKFLFEIKDQIELLHVDSAPFIKVCYTPTSEELDLEYLLSLTSIKPTNTIIKGDFFSNGKFQYNYNGLHFESFSEPGPLETKIKSLLSILETDPSGIKKLIKQTNCKDLFITIVYHNGTGIFTGLYLDNVIIDRLSKLGLELTFDIYARGKKFINE